jgi:hypothetical protein
MPGLQATACPRPTRALSLARAVNDTIIFAVVNSEMLDFGLNWYHHLHRLGATNAWVRCASPGLQTPTAPVIFRVSAVLECLMRMWTHVGWFPCLAVDAA